MKKIGWEIQPLGLLLVIVATAALCYAVVKWIRRPSSASEKES